MAQNLVECEQSFVPLLKAAKDRGISYRVVQCPMPGWTPGDNFHTNMGQDSRSLFQYLKDEGYAFLIAGMHVK